jgi:hypothetical protein
MMVFGFFEQLAAAFKLIEEAQSHLQVLRVLLHDAAMLLEVPGLPTQEVLERSRNTGLFWLNIGLFWRDIGLFWRNI